MMFDNKPVLIMAGGTGGHVYPALAVAQELLEKGVPVVWMGTKAGLEATIVPEENISIEWLSITGLRGKNFLTLLLAPIKILIACIQAAKILKKVKPRLVLGMGGFVSGPGGLMSRLFGLPLIIHEQNAVAGLTNRILARFANLVLQAFPNAFSKSINAIHTGNPVRRNISEVQQKNYTTDKPLRLLVVGGSLGALALNEIVPKAIKSIPEGLYPEVIHQTGLNHFEKTQALYESYGISADVKPYIKDMAETYVWADLVICRCGAMTVAELAITGTASILVPFPYAVDDHQTKNAEYLVNAGAAILAQQKGLTSEQLGDWISALSVDRNRLQEMGRKAHQCAKPDATQMVVKHCLMLGGESL